MPSKAVKRQLWMPPQAKRPDILMTLPAELRNAIYGEVLLNTKAVEIGARKVQRRRGQAVWREPALLKTSRAIRAEASSVYYKGNDFVVEAMLADLGKACRWLKHLIERCGKRLFRTMITRITYPALSGLHYGRNLAKLFRETGLEVAPGVLPSSKAKPTLLRTSHRHDWHIGAALRVFIELGQKAATEGWDGHTMDGDFDRRLELLHTTSSVRKDSKRWRLISEV